MEAHKEIKLKLKKIFKKSSLLKEWTDTSFRSLPKRWTGAYGRKDGLTEFEAAGGKDNIKLGKLYTDKDLPPFATNKQIEELNLDELKEGSAQDYKKVQKLLTQVKSGLSELIKYGEDYNVFQSAKYAAKTLKKAWRDVSRIT